MPLNTRMTILLAIASLLLLFGCAPSRTYTEGILAKNDTFISPGELQDYEAKIGQEIERVKQGGAVPAGVARDVYLEDLKARQEAVRTRIVMMEHFRQKDEFDDKYPSP